MKSLNKAAVILSALLVCLLLTATFVMPASADLIIGSAPDNTVDDESRDGGDSSAEESRNESIPTVSVDDDFPDDSSTGDDDESSSTVHHSSSVYSEPSYDRSDDNDYDSSEDHDQSYENYSSVRSGNIAGNAGSGNDSWGTGFSGTDISEEPSSSKATAKKNIADYYTKMQSLIWIPIALIIVAAVTLIAVNAYYASKKKKPGRHTGNDDRRK